MFLDIDNPTQAFNLVRSMSWMVFGIDIPTQPLDRRDFCVIAHENITSVLSVFERNSTTCRDGKIILSLPDVAADDLPSLEALFKLAWIAGVIDLVAVVSGPKCRVFSAVPFKKSAKNCNDSTPVLINSWDRESTCNFTNDTVIYFPENKVSSLDSCSVDVIVTKSAFKYWSPLIKFLEVAMNATFNIDVTTRSISSDDPGCELPTIYISTRTADESAMSYTLSSYFKATEMMYAVPHRPIASVQSFRLLNELSSYVWYGLIVAVVAGIATLFHLVEGRKDFVYVVLLGVQPLVGTAWSADFLPWRGRVFFAMWHLFCLIMSAAYLCEFLSEMTVPFTEDAIKSYADLVKSDIPIHARIHESTIGSYRAFSPYFNEIQSRLVLLQGVSVYDIVKRNRHDIAYIFSKSLFDTFFVNMPYHLLPEVVHTDVTVAFRMNKPNPYERFFEIAFMRAIGAGALYKVASDDRQVDLPIILRHIVWEEEGPQPLPLGSYVALFTVWAMGCGLASLVFILEYCFRLEYFE